MNFLKILENICVLSRFRSMNKGKFCKANPVLLCVVWCSVPAASNLFDMRRLEHIIKLP